MLIKYAIVNINRYYCIGLILWVIVKHFFDNMFRAR